MKTLCPYTPLGPRTHGYRFLLLHHMESVLRAWKAQPDALELGNEGSVGKMFAPHG